MTSAEQLSYNWRKLFTLEALDNPAMLSSLISATRLLLAQELVTFPSDDYTQQEQQLFDVVMTLAITDYHPKDPKESELDPVTLEDILPRLLKKLTDRDLKGIDNHLHTIFSSTKESPESIVSAHQFIIEELQERNIPHEAKEDDLDNRTKYFTRSIRLGAQFKLPGGILSLEINPKDLQTWMSSFLAATQSGNAEEQQALLKDIPPSWTEDERRVVFDYIRSFIIIPTKSLETYELSFKGHKGRKGKRGGSLPKSAGLHTRLFGGPSDEELQGNLDKSLQLIGDAAPDFNTVVKSMQIFKEKEAKQLGLPETCVAYADPGTGTLMINSKYLAQWPPYKMTETLIHEYTHLTDPVIKSYSNLRMQQIIQSGNTREMQKMFEAKMLGEKHAYQAGITWTAGAYKRGVLAPDTARQLIQQNITDYQNSLQVHEAALKSIGIQPAEQSQGATL